MCQSVVLYGVAVVGTSVAGEHLESWVRRVALPRAQRDHSIPTVHQLHSHTLRLCPEKWLF